MTAPDLLAPDLEVVVAAAYDETPGDDRALPILIALAVRVEATVLARPRLTGTSGDAYDDALEEIADAVDPTVDALERVLYANVPTGQGRTRALQLVTQLRAELRLERLSVEERDRLVEDHDRRLDR